MNDIALPEESPCTRCGACCAAFRVSFYWAEAAPGGALERLSKRLGPWRACLEGTDLQKPRCTALGGEVGRRVQCTVYGERPSPCREVQPGDDKCRQARARHGLPPEISG